MSDELQFVAGSGKQDARQTKVRRTFPPKLLVPSTSRKSQDKEE